MRGWINSPIFKIWINIGRYNGNMDQCKHYPEKGTQKGKYQNREIKKLKNAENVKSKIQ